VLERRASPEKDQVMERSEAERLLIEALPLLDVVARRMERRLGGLMPLDELLSMGRLALLDIVDAYDPERARFAPYCAQRLKWALIDAVRKDTHGRVSARARSLSASERFGTGYAAELKEAGPAEPTDEANEARLKSLLAGHAAALAVGLVASLPNLERTPHPEKSPEDRAAERQLSEQMRAQVAKLPDRERTLVERHYFGDEPFDAIAKDLGISKSWASRLHAQAMRRLQDALKRSVI
jgi:RNA polymerase sigma factor for flagellar operon FliA